ncbi:hypothetical protein V6N11_058025 [Hibiscus sabdariffa]|uniref:Uncharacterized protein n=1 Tax=Hibiscus sabdariffa TaxID=183260 RepID=A0ABR2A6W8_9ROSI
MESAWQGIRQEGVSDSLVIKMRAMKVVLKECNRDSFGNVDSKYQEIVDEIEELDARFNEGELGSNELKHKLELYSKLWVISRLWEAVWRKKSRVLWLVEGDRNTNFFYRQERMRMV